jgi:hypothetical protein
MRPEGTLRGLIVFSLAWTTVACGLFQVNYVEQAKYLHSSEGFEEWKKGEKELRDAAEVATENYRREGSMKALGAYDRAVHEYLDHGFALLRAYKAATFTLPPGLEASLEQRTNQLMDVADEYLKQGSEIVAVALSREVIHNYSDVERMDRAQRRAEGILFQYRYQRNY